MRLERAGIEGGVGLDEAQHRREQRRDHARALALRAEQDRAVREPHLQTGALRPAVAGQDRLREGSSAVRAELPDGLLDAADDPVALQLDADHAGGGHADARVFDVRARRPPLRAIASATSTPRAPVPTLALPAFTATPRSRSSSASRETLMGAADDRVAREQRGR